MCGKKTREINFTPESVTKEFWRDNEHFADLAARNHESGKLKNSEEFLSGLQKTDRLVPCYTVVLYYGEKEWDGPRTLADMMEFGNSKDGTKLFCDYPMNLICMNEAVEYPFCNKDVRDLFLLTQSFYRDGGLGLAEGGMRRVSTKVVYTAAVITGTLDVYGKAILQEMESRKEEIDMCEKVRELLETTKSEGVREGIKEGTREKAKEIALNMLKKGLDYEFVAECAGVSVETVKAWEQEACCLV